jgi:hypothetical protein
LEIAALTGFLAPFLPYLVTVGKNAAEDASREFGEQAWTHAKAVWQRLRPSVESEPTATKAARRVANDPGDDRAVTALELELKDLLDANEALRADVERLWGDAQAANVTAIGARSVAAVNVVNSTIVTGDDAQIG